MAGLLDFLRDPEFQDQAMRDYYENIIKPTKRYVQQGLGGATAGLLGAPVDLATLALNAGGAGLDPSKQFGGSASTWRGLNLLGLLAPQGNEPADIVAQMAGPVLLNPQTAGMGLHALSQGLRGIASSTPKVGPSAQAGVLAYHGGAPIDDINLGVAKSTSGKRSPSETFWMTANPAHASDYAMQLTTVPDSMWRVRVTGTGKYNSGMRPEYEFFRSRRQAEEAAASINNGSFAKADDLREITKFPPVVSFGDVQPKNPLIVDAKGRRFDFIRFGGQDYDTDGLAEYARSKGHDAVVIKNVLDPGGVSMRGQTTIYGILDPSIVKLGKR